MAGLRVRFRKAPPPARAVGDVMSIDKNSTGVPEINVHKRTTKVNLWMVAAVIVFLAFMAVTAVWTSREENHLPVPAAAVTP